ncbi:MAG: tetratricopeptide repeat protein [Thermomicrobiales bacterium]|nr:tetratricopeptide repeat protein [Thermomicrobiales bacterium]
MDKVDSMDMTLSQSMRAEQLPITLTPMIGRTDETALLLKLLQDSSTRLVTLLGPGGVGKTRLALHAGEIVNKEAKRSVTFVPLALIRSPELALQVIANHLGIYSQSPEPHELIAQLAETRVILLLDNLEQLPEIGGYLQELLTIAPGITILATSQSPVGIDDEQVLQVGTLDVPGEGAETEAIEQSAAVQLFRERAQATLPHFQLEGQEQTVADLCRALDGLPLALRLAAARTNIFTPAAMLARINNRLNILSTEETDLPPRQRTMRAAIGWSYDLLTPEEQYLLRRLSAFAGGFTIEAMEIVAAGAYTTRSPYDLLGGLVNHSLVQTLARADGEARYIMLETVRAYGLEQLVTLGEAQAAQQEHAEIMAMFADDVEAHVIGPDQEIWMPRVDDAIDNARLAIAWSLENGRNDIVLRIVSSLWRYLSTRGLSRYGLQWMQQALVEGGTISPQLRAKGLVCGANLALDLRDWKVAHGWFEQGRYLAGAIGDRVFEARALIGLGSVSSDQSRYDAAEVFQQQAADLARASGDKRSLAVALGNLASLRFLRGNAEDAVAFGLESMQLMQELGDMAAVALAENNLGAYYIELCEWELAEASLQRALAWQRRISDVRDITFTLVNLGEVARQLGDYTLAYDSHTEAALIARRTNMPLMEGYALAGLSHLAITQKNLATAVEYLRECLSVINGATDGQVVLDCTHQMVRLAAAQGNHTTVVELMTADRTVRKQLNAPKTARMLQDVEPLERTAISILTTPELEAAQEVGERMDLESLARHLLVLARSWAGKQQPTPVPPTPPIPEQARHNLTPREIEILTLLAQGHSTQQIADTLFISPRTIATHVTSILGKLGVQNRTAAVAWALRVGIA